MQQPGRPLPRVRQQLGKYRIERKLAEGGFAAVYRAFDTIEGVSVALKIPYPQLLSGAAVDNIKREIRLTARLDHPNICPIKNAEVIDGLFVIATPLGVESLADRLTRRLSPSLALSFTEQLLGAVAFAHQRHLIHCDIKPDNVILFPGPVLKLTDFGIAKVWAKTQTVYASISGTVGYIAPEQALGRPSARSDVFSLGLVIYRLFSGELPTWPYDWPPAGFDRLKRNVSPPMIELLRRSIQIDDRRRHRDGRQMAAAFAKIKSRALRAPPKRRRSRKRRTAPKQPRWPTVRFVEFQRQHGKALETKWQCGHCRGPVSEAMSYCPWCSKPRKQHRDPTSFPTRCRRCGRGKKSDWRYCAWCYGRGEEVSGEQRYSDRRYATKCTDCRGPLMPFMRYCPWCRAKVRRQWPLPTGGSRCKACGWGILPEYWEFCPWCGRGHKKRRPA